MQCQKCGSQIADGSQYCSVCGQRQTPVTAPHARDPFLASIVGSLVIAVVAGALAFAAAGDAQWARMGNERPPTFPAPLGSGQLTNALPRRFQVG